MLSKQVIDIFSRWQFHKNKYFYVSAIFHGAIVNDDFDT